MAEFHDWEDIRAELGDGDSDALAAERARTEAWIQAFHLDVNEVATLSRYAQALGAEMRIIFDYGNYLRQIA
jgi:hypothetical protein